MKNGSGALSRFTVIDLTRVRAGPTCVRQFADWGANVIKVESPDGSADFAARHDPDFQNLHRNKRSITLNLKTPEGLAVLKKLVERADVLVENYRPDVKDRLGIDYESLKKVNKRLVYTSHQGSLASCSKAAIWRRSPDAAHSSNWASAEASDSKAPTIKSAPPLAEVNALPSISALLAR